jgi:hypothetical protein
VHYERSKHINVHFHLIQEHVKNKDEQMSHVARQDQVADIFMKALPTELFNNYKINIKLKDEKYLSLREEFVK